MIVITVSASTASAPSVYQALLDAHSARLVLPHAHYVDAFRIESAQALLAERWCREFLEGGNAAGRAAMQLAWRVPLGLRLGLVTDPALVAGWQVRTSDSNLCSLHATSWMLEVGLAFCTSANSVTVITAVRYKHPVARAIWGSVLGAAHRSLMPKALRNAWMRLQGARLEDELTSS